VAILLACKRGGSPEPETKSSAASSASTGTALPTATASETATTSTAQPCRPYRQRCTDACKKAHFAALDTCSVESKAFFGAIPDEKAVGECSAHCLKTKNDTGCVGAATEAECACMFKCSDGLPADVRKKGEVYVRCYDNAVAAACK